MFVKITYEMHQVLCNIHNLKGKTGEIPERSRHCNGERLIKKPLFQLKWEGIRSDEPKPGDLPVVCAWTLRVYRGE